MEGVRAVGASGLSAGWKLLQLGRTFSGPKTDRKGADSAAPSNQAQQHRKNFLYVSRTTEAAKIVSFSAQAARLEDRAASTQ
jgi:hypothetical protein